MRTGEVPKSSNSLRLFRWDDLEEYTRLVNLVQGLKGQPGAFSTPYMEEWLRQPGCNPEESCFLEECEEVLAGYAMVVSELAIGRVVVEGGVMPDYRLRGIGGRLLESALQRAHALGADVMHIAVPEDSPGSHTFLERRGFTLARRYWRMRWPGSKVAQPALPPGFSLRSFAPGDEELLTQVQNAAFAGSWGFCPNTVEEISYRAKLSRCSPEGILFVEKGNETVAYCWTRIDGDGGERAGIAWMAGVLPPYRGLALGQAVLLAGMGYLQSQGVDSIELTVDEENTRAQKIWLSMGFRKVAETRWYERKLRP